MKTPAIIEGLTILQKYRHNPDGYHVGAEHDQIYAFPTDKPLSREDLTRMVELGWIQEGTDFYDDEQTLGNFTTKHYDPAETWSCHV